MTTPEAPQPPDVNARSAVRIQRMNEFIELRFGGERSRMLKEFDFSKSDRSLFYQIFGKKAARNFGERVARRWEARLGLPTFWLDREPTRAAIDRPVSALDPARLDVLPPDALGLLASIAERFLAPYEAAAALN